eukprot:CAMPEP_0171065600 /NCGR_PEP_ID=MMETSP0766_2-20121228/6938_1 /TAXON_ID=439317 /ORGANISM="Gambierdiscus australes, Strain CAWD 149" /LENGTH=443 /DNA_ID=CAMNT_0011521713 /DNA_START=96 /DNA_END=1427 /DNA_ORIENTATION=+
MHTTNEWHQHSAQNMTQAQTTHKKAHRQNDASAQAHQDAVSENLGMYNELRGSLEHKVKVSHRLIDGLQKRADSLETSIQQQQGSLALLEEALRAKDPPLQLCLHRLERRERRPLREQVRDSPETALEGEKATLADTQRRLKEGIRKTKAMITELQGKLKEVRHDLDHKVQAVGIDETCLRTAARSHDAALELSRSPASSGRAPLTQRRTGNNAGTQESHKNELERQKEAARLSQAAAAVEEGAKLQRDDNKLLIARCQKAVDDAKAKAERSLQERINENQQMRKRLEGELRETGDKMEQTKRTIAETKAQLRALEEPMDLTTTCASFRQQRATREHITDPVTSKIAEHQLVVLRAREELLGHHQQEKANLQELVERRDRLKDDVRDKTSAMHVDLDCLTHEAVHSNGKPTTFLSKNKLARAMKIDARFVPMPGVSMQPMTAR